VTALLPDLALIATLVVVGWGTLDIAVDRVRRRRLEALGVLGAAAGVWIAGELLLQNAASPAERLFARRILFAGVCVVPPAWLWSALVAPRLHETRRYRRLFGVLLLPGAFFWSCLFWDQRGWFIDWYAMPARHGPLFAVHTAWSWALIAGATFWLLRTGIPAARDGFRLKLGIAAGALLPLVTNLVHILLYRTSVDPTPIAIGVSGVIFRGLVFSFAWATAQPPFATRKIFAQMREGLLVADAAGRVVDWNPASAELLGTQELEGQPLEDLLEDLKRRRGREVEARRFPIEWRGQAFADGVVLADRTELRQAELRLEVATRLESLGALAAGVAHEVNNPLSYIGANLTLLDPVVAALAEPGVQAALPEDLRERAGDASRLVSDCRDGAERIRRIVQSLSQFTDRGPPAEPRPHDIRVPVEKAIALVAFRKPERHISVSSPEQVPRICAAEADVLQIVLHLLLNAIQMGGEGVPIAIGIEGDERGVCVCVVDGGPGIPAEDLRRVFDPFFTTQRPGPSLGLGLSLCWELARRNGGRLEAENRPEGGAVFTLWLPAADAA
jgi:signal transduction histidine kinase